MNRRVLLMAAGVLIASVTLAEESAKKCCFDHKRYQGTCEVTPAQGETCQGIIDYLNNPNSTGKSYCGGTTIRGGWTAASCKAAQ